MEKSSYGRRLVGPTPKGNLGGLAKATGEIESHKIRCKRARKAFDSCMQERTGNDRLQSRPEYQGYSRTRSALQALLSGLGTITRHPGLPREPHAHTATFDGVKCMQKSSAASIATRKDCSSTTGAERRLH